MQYTKCILLCDGNIGSIFEEETEIKFQQSPRKRSDGSIHYKSEERLTTCASNHRSNAIMETIEEHDSSIDL